MQYFRKVLEKYFCTKYYHYLICSRPMPPPPPPMITKHSMFFLLNTVMRRGLCCCLKRTSSTVYTLKTVGSINLQKKWEESRSYACKSGVFDQVCFDFAIQMKQQSCGLLNEVGCRGLLIL